MRVCVFCGSSTGRGERYVRSAEALGGLLAERGIGLVYGGASVGTMGVLADAALRAGGEVIGVIPEALTSRELAHTGLSELLQVKGMHERKAKMAELSDGFLALPGGAGTLEELFEVWTWSQLGLHAKPIGLVDVDGYYQPLLRFVRHMVDEGFLRESYHEMLAVDPDPAALLDRLAAALRPRPNACGSEHDVRRATVIDECVHPAAGAHVSERSERADQHSSPANAGTERSEGHA